MKEEYVKKEHYIPQFALKYFQNEDGRIPFTDIKKKPLKIITSKSNNLMHEKDFYEIKDSEGIYILRNTIEDNYSFFEGRISRKFQRLLDLSFQDDFQNKFVELVMNGEWAVIEAELLLYMVFLLIRSKGVKNLTYSKSKLPQNYQHILHLLMTTTPTQTAEFAKNMFNGEELENILYFIKNDTEAIPIKTLSEHIMNNYQIRVCKVKETKRLFLSDNPVIVQKFEGEDYILPISPNVCIILVPMNINDETIQIDTHVYSLNDVAVKKINEQSILNTDRLIIISDERDLIFIEQILSL
ncbi:DUF4238 domain-containing protein [Enterococcus hulanensis]|nr:DUF4238 domain-containing protein [Enterococcus hulanensis]